MWYVGYIGEGGIRRICPASLASEASMSGKHKIVGRQKLPIFHNNLPGRMRRISPKENVQQVVEEISRLRTQQAS